jgi:predicted DsbA family dithiol-disulfide isomerase
VVVVVEVWADVACPWCYVGKRRFEAALRELGDDADIEVRWRSFELDPRAPRTQPLSAPEVLARKYRVSLDQANAMNARLKAEARKEGLELAPEKIRMVNTFDAHRLIHYANGVSRGAEMTERLFQAYHVEGEDLADIDNLVELGAQLGLDRSTTRKALENDDFAADVRADEQRAADFGISGVPFFAIDERLGISGAQPVEVFVSALRQAAQAA